MSLDCDIVVVGAGCAGLSLAVHAIEAGLGDRRLVLLERRADFGRDRTWCFFDVEPHPFDAVTTHAWTRVAVATDAHTVVRATRAHPYVHLPSDAFYTEARRRIDATPNVELRLDTDVRSVSDDGDRVVVDTDAGELRTSVVFDGRPSSSRINREPTGDPNEIYLLQHFSGWFIETDEPRFDPERAMLMDFRVSQLEGIHFVYLLPFSEREALVEDTYFSNVPMTPEAYDDNLREYLDRMGIDGWRIVHRERGAIPMTTETYPLRPSPRVYRIGLAGGLARPSTGYAFLAIQRFSRALASHLAHDPLPAAPRIRSQRTLLLDRTFLGYLDRHPDNAPLIFTRLFDRVPIDVLARFLCEVSAVTDELAVMSALPKLPFARSMMRSLSPWMRNLG